MKYLRQFGIILAVTCIGELFKYFIELPIPSSIYGLVLMLTLLKTGLIKVEHVKDTGVFLIDIMPLMFIPAGVGLLLSWKQLKNMLLPVCVITIITTILVMIVSGKVTDYMIKRRKPNE
ncbi:MAG: CidA/LrgA family protein [Candidatus Galacturonibacter soehngenii]|nr:CidA/LrgA family protein [Candidatus Galacturonibacter soehngenii]